MYTMTTSKDVANFSYFLWNLADAASWLFMGCRCVDMEPQPSCFQGIKKPALESAGSRLVKLLSGDCLLVNSLGPTYVPTDGPKL
jgi:hypothetical protein